MRQIEKEMNYAVRNKIAWSKSNSCTTFDSTIENCFVYLHGNHIATYNYADKELSLYDGGWQSVTTRKVFSTSDSIVHSSFKFSHNNKKSVVVWLL